MDFNKERFLNFGRYDLIINKSFYRTMALICIFGSTGIAFVAFFGRWLMANAFNSIDIYGTVRTIPSLELKTTVSIYNRSDNVFVLSRSNLTIDTSSSRGITIIITGIIFYIII